MMSRERLILFAKLNHLAAIEAGETMGADRLQLYCQLMVQGYGQRFNVTKEECLEFVQMNTLEVMEAIKTRR